MDIILLKNIEKVGRKFEIVNVKAGYGRNYLIPQGLAIVANKANRSNLDSYKRREASKLTKMIDQFKAIAEKVKGQELTIEVKAGTSGRIFGSVTNLQVAYALKAQLDVEVDRRDIILPEHIKEVGHYVAELDLHPDVEAKIALNVIADDPTITSAIQAHRAKNAKDAADAAEAKVVADAKAAAEAKEAVEEAVESSEE
ncbi:MAG: 50S ribosomal protein L9 [Lewinellaceae bacterium]|nr:50S ribosomal protein L9 [Saprospiraceae bacterium]MCB9338154.1 50S ribosomal protein L9 [Lewinellaceae bacterium]